MKSLYNVKNLNQVIKQGATLLCGMDWEVATIKKFLPHFNSEMLNTVIRWLENDSAITMGAYLMVWCEEN